VEDSVLRYFRCQYLFSLSSFLFASVICAQTGTSSARVIALGMQDQRGQFVEGIQSEQILVTQPVARIQHLELDSAPRRILLLLDTSGSMGNYQTLSWSNVAEFTRRFTRQRDGDDAIGLDTFAEKDQVLVPFTADSQLVVTHLDEVKNSGMGRTMLGNALTQILARKENQLRFGDAIVLVSDGDRSQDDKTDFARLRDALIRGGIRICLVRVPSIIPTDATVDATDVSSLVSDTGGIELDMAGTMPVQLGNGVRVNSQALDSNAKAAYAFVRAYYQVSLEVSGTLGKPNRLHLEVVDQKRRKLKGVKLNYPRYLLPLSSD